MTYNVVQSKGLFDEWRVEAIDYEREGEVYLTIFSGPLAEERAKEYATWKQEMPGFLLNE